MQSIVICGLKICTVLLGLLARSTASYQAKSPATFLKQPYSLRSVSANYMSLTLHRFLAYDQLAVVTVNEPPFGQLQALLLL